MSQDDDQRFWFGTPRDPGLAVYGGSDVGEVVATSSGDDHTRAAGNARDSASPAAESR
ncbi:hypothetical protein [Streptomyces sp. CNQ085]|uniref:hypothetical protein n=1 Tax=Streptomyces sp. CNQ085 TaxID=2886944 RepID=UPI001F50CA76|nr:hypothetical protein [Streptomyces sp. CNQ085]MCI0386100.1 hypothetical protein [Streptomyces sp. CNQ085]